MMITPCSVRSPYLASFSTKPYRGEVTVAAAPADSSLVLGGSVESAVGSTTPASTHSWKSAGLLAFMAIPLMAGALTGGILTAGSAQAAQAPMALTSCVTPQPTPTGKVFPNDTAEIKTALQHLWKNGVEIQGADPAKPVALAAAAVDLHAGNTRIAEFDPFIDDINYKTLVDSNDVLKMADVVDGCETHLSDMEKKALRAIKVIRDNGGSFGLGTLSSPYLELSSTPAGTARLLMELSRAKFGVIVGDGGDRFLIRSMAQLVNIANAIGK